MGGEAPRGGLRRHRARALDGLDRQRHGGRGSSSQLVSGLSRGTAYHWRARMVGFPDAFGQLVLRRPQWLERDGLPHRRDGGDDGGPDHPGVPSGSPNPSHVHVWSAGPHPPTRTRGSRTIGSSSSSNGGTSWSAPVYVASNSYSHVSPAEGSWLYRITARDNALNQSAAVTSAVPVAVDLTLPTVAIRSPAAGSFVTPANQAAFMVSGTCSENGRSVSIGGAATASPTCTAGGLERDAQPHERAAGVDHGLPPTMRTRRATRRPRPRATS